MSVHAKRSLRRLVGWAHGLGRASIVCSLASLAGVTLAGCSKAEPKPNPAPARSAPKPVKAKLEPKDERVVCHEVLAGARFLVGEVGRPPRDAGDDEGGAVDLPFAVEAGGAVATHTGFALAALKGNRAVAALVTADAAGGTELALEEEVHGDVEPPKLVSRGDQLVAAIVGNDAGGVTLTLASIQQAGSGAVLKRGAQITHTRDASPAFDLALGANAGLMVWDEWDEALGHGSIEAIAFNPKAIDREPKSFRLSPEGDDGEMPRVVERPGGFWLAYVSHGALASTKGALTPRKGPLEPRKAGLESKQRPPAFEKAKGNPEAAEDESDFDSVVDVTPRRLRLVPLDASGAPIAEPRLVTSADAHVLAYDMVPYQDGVVLAWRDDPTSLGAEAPKVYVARVGLDGNVTVEIIEDEELAVGAPRLFLDAGDRARPHLWLALLGERGKTRIGYFSEPPKLAGPLSDVSEFGVSEPLALRDGRFLLGRPNGRALDLSAVRCGLEPVRR